MEAAREIFTSIDTQLKFTEVEDGIWTYKTTGTVPYFISKKEGEIIEKESKYTKVLLHFKLNEYLRSYN